MIEKLAARLERDRRHERLAGVVFLDVVPPVDEADHERDLVVGRVGHAQPRVIVRDREREQQRAAVVPVVLRLDDLRAGVGDELAEVELGLARQKAAVRFLDVHERSAGLGEGDQVRGGRPVVQAYLVPDGRIGRRRLGHPDFRHVEREGVVLGVEVPIKAVALRGEVIVVAVDQAADFRTLEEVQRDLVRVGRGRSCVGGLCRVLGGRLTRRASHEDTCRQTEGDSSKPRALMNTDDHCHSPPCSRASNGRGCGKKRTTDPCRAMTKQDGRHGSRRTRFANPRKTSVKSLRHDRIGRRRPGATRKHLCRFSPI